jgi:hypothetical protein
LATKVSIKVKGTPQGVKKALKKIAAEPPTRPLREADFRTRQKTA